MAELQHRVRNTLAVVRSVARRTRNTSSTIDEYVANFEGRVDALARVQAAVTRDPANGLDLEQLVRQEIHAHAARDGGQAVRVEGPTIRLQPRAAESFGLALHELATNALKHGGLSSEDGRVAITWRIEAAVDGAPRLVFDWTETGMQFAGERPARKGFGTELNERTLSYDLGAQTSLLFEPEGLRCVIALSLTGRIVTKPSQLAPVV